MRKDDLTEELPGVPRRPGRPATGKAMSAAERQAARRARLAAQGKGQLSVMLPVDLLAKLDKFLEFKDETKDGAVERALVAFLRKR